MKETLKNALKPLYKRLLEEVCPQEDLAPFCLQWGANFPTAPGEGIIFVGRATNGWVSDGRDIEKLFDGEPHERVFCRPDQMQWVENLEGPNEVYNTRKSQFWQVAKGVSQPLYGTRGWSSHIAWSNLYKMAPPEGGNPAARHINAQYELCVEILRREIDTLSPRFVIFLTSGWERAFIRRLNNDEPTCSVEKTYWGSRDHETRVYRIDGRIFIASAHPQGKNIQDHVDALRALVAKYSR